MFSATPEKIEKMVKDMDDHMTKYRADVDKYNESHPELTYEQRAEKFKQLVAEGKITDRDYTDAMFLTAILDAMIVRMTA